MCCWPVCDSVEEGLQQSVWERDLPGLPRFVSARLLSPLALCTLPATRQVGTCGLRYREGEPPAHSHPPTADSTGARSSLSALRVQWGHPPEATDIQ